jgi:hypothetical protein
MDGASWEGLHVMGITRYYLNQIVDICREYEEAIESGEIRTDFEDDIEKMVRFDRICEIVKDWRNGRV